ncbi:MAG: D-alanyl-D-alanine carboxypeptidase family protein [Pseudomonadota bacterium]
MNKKWIAASLVAAVSAGSPAAAFDTSARAALVIDMLSGATLLTKNADVPLPPASMSKLMTLNMVFEALQEGRLSLNETFRVSEKAWRMGGSRMFVREGDRISVEDLIRGVIIQSGNDACVVLAEGLAGSEDAFAKRMTERAKALGMTQSVFINSTGWPHPDHKMSTEDLMFLIKRMIVQFPEYYPYFAETEFEWDGVKQNNRNPLLYLDIGADGLKTGHTEEAGYGLTGSAIRDGRRIAFVISGLETQKARSVESERLMTWAFREFKTAKVASAGQIVGEAKVWIGAETTVPLTPATDVIATVPFGALKDMKATIRYDGPVPAPITMGDEVAELVIEAPGIEPMSTPLIAAGSVEMGGVLTRVSAAIQSFILAADVGTDATLTE